MDAGPTVTDSEQRQPSEGEAGFRYRATWPQRLLTSGPLLLLYWYLYVYLDVVRWDRSPGSAGPPIWSRVELSVLPVLVVLGAWAHGWWFGVTLTPRAAVVRSLWRRTIPWTGVAAVEVEAFGWGGRRIVLYEAAGRRTPLRMPSTVFLAGDRRFDAKAAVIRGWWLTHGGTDHDDSVGTQSTPELLPDRLRLRPTAVQTAPVAMLLTLLAIEATIAGFTTASGTALATTTNRALGVSAAILLLLTAGQLCLRSGVTLTSGHLRVDGVRHRTLAWSQVQAITVEPRRGGRRVVVTDLHGRRTLLAVPRLGFLLWDDDFEPRVAILHRFWRTHRGADLPSTTTAERAPEPVAERAPESVAEQAPEPVAERAPEPVSEQVPAPYNGPRVWQRVVFVIVCACLGWMVLMWVLIGGIALDLG